MSVAETAKETVAGGESLASPTTAQQTSPATPTTVQQGGLRLLASLRGVTERASKLLVKLVHRIFPWNRRARRRVLGDGEDDEL